jgi:hypothetical protein
MCSCTHIGCEPGVHLRPAPRYSEVGFTVRFEEIFAHDLTGLAESNGELGFVGKQSLAVRDRFASDVRHGRIGGIHADVLDGLF